MSFKHNGLVLTEHVALHSDGTRDFNYTLEEAILPRSIAMSIIALDMAPDVEIINDIDDPHDLYFNHQACILKELFTGDWIMRVEDCCNTIYSLKNYKFIFKLNNDKTELEYTVYYCPSDSQLQESLFNFCWTIDELDSIDAINWNAGQSFDELIGIV